MKLPKQAEYMAATSWLRRNVFQLSSAKLNDTHAARASATQAYRPIAFGVAVSTVPIDCE
jgi:hypothetical protein